MTGEKKVVIIAGPNGAGKTTFALEFLPNEAENFENLYKQTVDEWVVYDNSGLTPVLLEKGGKNER
jgi:predicted ABC-type ATPase